MLMINPCFRLVRHLELDLCEVWASLCRPNYYTQEMTTAVYFLEVFVVFRSCGMEGCYFLFLRLRAIRVLDISTL